MFDLTAAVIYGIVQGITEFMPISSSGHLAILPRYLSIEDPGVAFDLAMHVGTALSIIVYFNSDIRRLLGEAYYLLCNRGAKPKESYFLINIIAATAVSFLVIVLLKSFALAHGRDHQLIAVNLAAFGVVMLIADLFFPQNKDKSMDAKQIGGAVLIGAAQALAIFPGVSRAGITLTAGRFLGLTRLQAARFSFLLSLPVIIVGFIYKLPEITADTSNFDLMHCSVGMAASFVVGVLAIHFLLGIIGRVGLGVFCIYRIILAALLWF